MHTVPPILIHATPDITYATPGALRTIRFRVYNDPQPAILSSSITWWFNGQLLNTTGEKYTSSFSGSTGDLTIRDIEVADDGFYVANVSHSTGIRTISFEVIVKSNSQNNNNIMHSHSTSYNTPVMFSHTHTDPPLPLANLTVTLLSECTASASWNDPPPPNAVTAVVDYIIIEVQIDGSSQWTLGTTDPVAVSDRSTEVFLPGSVADGIYHFRTYSESKVFGRGENSPTLSSITAYPTSTSIICGITLFVLVQNFKWFLYYKEHMMWGNHVTLILSWIQIVPVSAHVVGKPLILSWMCQQPKVLTLYTTISCLVSLPHVLFVIQEPFVVLY